MNDDVLIKIKRIVVILDCRSAMYVLKSTKNSDDNLKQVFGVVLETFLQDDLGFIVRNRYRTSKLDLYNLGSDVVNVINQVKLELWSILTDKLPSFKGEPFTATVDYVTDDLVEITIEKDENESKLSI